MAYLEVTNRTSSSITVQAQDLQFEDSFYAYFRFRINGGSWIQTSSKSRTFSGLSSNTTYSFDCETQIEQDRDTNIWFNVGSTSGTTLYPVPSSPTIYLLDKTETAISTYASNETGADEYQWYLDGVFQGSASSGSNVVTFSNLTAGTTYTIGCKACNQSGCSGMTTRNITTDAPIPRPSNWSWFTAKVQGEDFQLTANEWNSFTSRINSFRDYKGLSTVSFTSAISSADFTASMFNIAATAIDGMNPSTSIPAFVSVGDDVTAFGLNRLRDSLNSIS